MSDKHNGIPIIGAKAPPKDPFVSALAQVYASAMNHEVVGLVVCAVLKNGACAGGQLIPSEDLTILTTLNASLDVEKTGLTNRIARIMKGHLQETPANGNHPAQ